VGLSVGIASERYVETLLYQVNATDLRMLALPAVTILAAALLAALPRPSALCGSTRRRCSALSSGI
jgi:hypothetical protein